MFVSPSGKKIAVKQQGNFYFDGFTFPTTTPMPDEIFDVLAPRLTESELRDLLYIVRRTFGFKKSSDAISISQMVNGIKTRDGKILDSGTGMGRKAVITGIKGLLNKGIIRVERALTERGDNEINIYRLRFKGEVKGVVSLGNYGSVLKTPPVVSLGNPQQTVLQETDNTVNVTKTVFKSNEDEEFRTEALVEDILEVTKDKRSKGFYRKIVRKCPDAMIYRALSEVKDTDRMGKIKKSKGAYFTSLIQKYSEEQGITI